MTDLSNIKISTITAAILCVFLLLFASVSTAQTPYGQGIARQPQTQDWIYLRAEKNDFRPKSEVVREVKRRYDARVLKISLNEKRGVYRVRILMPNGKVRNLTVNARR